MKSRLAKAAGAEPAGQRRDEKLHAVVARRTFPSQSAQNTSASESKKWTPLWRGSQHIKTSSTWMSIADCLPLRSAGHSKHFSMKCFSLKSVVKS